MLDEEPEEQKEEKQVEEEQMQPVNWCEIIMFLSLFPVVVPLCLIYGILLLIYKCLIGIKDCFNSIWECFKECFKFRCCCFTH
jgi:hypothetical protein